LGQVLEKSVKMEIGKWNELTVDRVKDFGAYLTDGTEDVLLPAKQLPTGVRRGDTLRVFLYRDSQDRLISTVNQPYIEMGELKKLRVKNVAGFGAFMDWGLEKDIFLPFKEQTAKVSEGKEYLVRMYMDKTGRLCVSMRLYDYLKPNDKYQKGDQVTGTVYEYKKGFGALVAIDDQYSGLIHENEIYSKIYVGDVVNARVVKVREDGKTDLALRNEIHLQINEDAEMVYSIIESYNGELPFTDKADKDLIMKEFGLSKNAFKRVVGHLLKEGKIQITEKSIRILNEQHK
jgi:hypothetical protein